MLPDKLKQILIQAVYQSILKQRVAKGTDVVELNVSVKVLGLSDDGKTALTDEGFTVVESTPVNQGNYIVSF